MPFYSDTLAQMTALLKNMDRSGIEDLYAYRNPVLARITKVFSMEDVWLGAGGRQAIATYQNMNAAPRAETGDVPYPDKDAFERFTYSLVEYTASSGITKKELEQVRDGKTAVADLSAYKLKHIQNNMRFRLNNAAKGDGTGRLATVNAVTENTSNAKYTITLKNSGSVFGWEYDDYLTVGQRVDVYTAADGNASGWTKKVTNFVITDINKSTDRTLTSIVLEIGVSGGVQGTHTADPATNDTIFAAGVVDITTSGAPPVYSECQGLMQIADDGSSTWTSPNGGYPYTTFQGLNRTLYPQLISRVNRDHWSGTSPGSWDLEDLLYEIREVNMNGTGGGEVTALYCSPHMAAAIARKAATNNNFIMNATPGEITGGFFTRKLICEGQTIPIVPLSGLPNHMILGIAEDDMRVVMPNPIGFEGPNGEEGWTWTGARNYTYEAWLRCELQLVATRCDNCFKLEGLSIDE